MIRKAGFPVFPIPIMLRNARVLKTPVRRVQQQSGGWA
jgi:hypothetical protein